MALIEESVDDSVSGPVTVICHNFRLQSGSIFFGVDIDTELKAQISVF